MKQFIAALFALVCAVPALAQSRQFAPVVGPQPIYTFTPAQDGGPRAPETVGDSVFIIHIIGEDPTKMGGGTAFLFDNAGSTVLLTNAHVCDNDYEFPNYYVHKGGTTVHSVQVIKSDKLADLCALRPTALMVDRTPLRLGKAPITAPGALITTVGYPRAQPPITYQVARYLGRIQFHDFGQDWDLRGISARVIPGQSGSPVLDERGEVVGVINMRDARVGGLYIPYETLVKFLEGVQ